MSVRSIAKAIIPAGIRRRLQYQNLLFSQPRAIRKLAEHGASDEAIFSAVVNSPTVYTLQKQSEILGLVHLCRELKAEIICEIGTQQGGTLILLMQLVPSLVQLVSLDIHMPFSRQLALKRARRTQHQLQFIVGDSKDRTTLQELERSLAGRKLDVLFIDGDHSFAGVKHDFEMYSPLVRPGGLIAFHDIVPDYAHARGVVTGRRTGDVPEFWKTVKDSYPSRELIDDPEQDGFGIGVLFV